MGEDLREHPRQGKQRTKADDPPEREGGKE